LKPAGESPSPAEQHTHNSTIIHINIEK